VAERIVSPGVFTNEVDLSFLPQAAGAIGACLIGPTTKGKAFIPTSVSSYSEFTQKFGGFTETSYLPYTAKSYLDDAPGATIVRVLGTGGYTLTAPLIIAASGSYGKRLISLLHPTYAVTNDGDSPLFEKTVVTTSTNGDFLLTISGSFTTDTAYTNAIDRNGTTFSCSINPESTNFIGKIFGDTAYGTLPVYNYSLFSYLASASLAEDPSTIVTIETGSLASPAWNFENEYSNASTPYITSQEVGGFTQRLFKFHTLSDGNTSNIEVKVGISNIRPAGTIAGSLYGQFDVIVRYVDQDEFSNTPFAYQDDDLRPSVVESFTCNLDPNSPLFIGRVIGDMNMIIDDQGTISMTGDYPNKSSYIRVEVEEAVKNGAIAVDLVPFGFESLYSPIPEGFSQPSATSFVQTQTINGVYNKRVFFGFDFGFAENDNHNYLQALPALSKLVVGNNTRFLLSDYNQEASAAFPSATSPYSGSINLTSNTSIDSRKFIIPFQGGFDGLKPNLQKRTGKDILNTNTQGFDISSTSADGYTAYKKAIDAVSNPDEFDLNLLIIPGVIHSLHSSITTYAKDLCEDRGDCFYIMDLTAFSDNINTAVSTVQGFDSNYAGAYYPWVKIVDTSKNKPVWVPPSVVLPGVIAFNDRVAAEWYAPAGLNRGGLTEVIDVKMRLNQDQRDTLYENRINPIATFPGQGVCVWGQKTLQGKPSALDRINVRRLLIAAKKYIASATRYLVFEQNTAATRNRFLNIVNPYLESIQQRQGLYAFRVIMDETNNTPDIIDRNIMYGQLYLQPTKTAEFIKLDFNIQPTGAQFPD
jgi:hypothetical protein